MRVRPGTEASKRAGFAPRHLHHSSRRAGSLKLFDSLQQRREHRTTQGIGPREAQAHCESLAPDYFTMCCRYAASKNPELQETHTKSLINNGHFDCDTEFVISAPSRRSDYAKTISHRRVEYAPLVFQFRGCTGAEQNRF